MSVNQIVGSFAQGDTVNYQFQIYAVCTTPATLIAPTGTYAIAASSVSPAILLAKMGDLTQSNGLWVMSVSLTSADTAALPPGRLYHQASVQDADGSNELVYSGMLIVTPAIPQALISASTSASV